MYHFSLFHNLKIFSFFCKICFYLRIFILGLTFIANRRSELLFLYPKNTLPKAPRLIGLIMEKSVIHGTWKKLKKFLKRIFFCFGNFGYFGDWRGARRLEMDVLDAEGEP